MIAALRQQCRRARRRHPRLRLRDESGLTFIEVLVSVLVMVVGTLGAFDTLQTSGHSISAAERLAVMTQVAQQYLASAEALPYANIADSSTPAQSSTTDKTNPTYYLSSCSGGTCYQWNPSITADVETVDISTTNGKVAPGPTSVVVPSPNLTGCTTTATTTCDVTLSVYVYVTETTDSVCSQSGVTCSTTPSYKRITVAVKNTGTGEPFNPVYLSTFVSNKIGGTSNPLTSASTTCLDGTTSVSCTY